MIKQTFQIINNNTGNLKLEYENNDLLDLIDPKKCTEKGCQQTEFRIGCPKCRLLSNNKDLRYYLKEKLEDLALPNYKSYLKKPCFNCPSSFHSSRYEDGNFHLRKKCDSQRIGPLDLIQTKRFMKKHCKESKFRMECPNSRLSDIKYLKQYIKNQLKILNRQAVGYKKHFKKQCFNCSFSFHGSSFEDGHFNLQKMSEVGKKCDTCQRNFTTERSFYHNCDICNVLFKNCQLLFEHRIRDHNSLKPNQCAVCDLSLSDGVSLSRHIFKHNQPINSILENLELKYDENIESFDLIQSKKLFEFHIEDNIEDIKNQLKEKLEDLKLQTVDYKSHFQIPCFNCPSSFHSSSFEDGHFNIQKLFAVEEKCIICQRNFTTERLFSHNCNICDASFKNCQLLVHHRRRKHNNSKKPHQCSACHLSLADGALNRHISKHNLPYVCPYCCKRYAEKSYLNSHILSVCKPSSEKEFKCKLCPMEFHDQNKFQGHQDLHAKRFLCKHCDKCFSSKKSLNLHLHRHNGKWKYNCTFCDKGFLTEKALASHNLSHTKEKPFQCKYCPKQYREKNSLNNHLFEHTGNKKFKCDSCDKTFAKQHLLNRHRPMHMETIFQCKYCPKKYKTERSLSLHLFEHTGDKNFSCDSCDKTFARQYLLNQHKLIHMDGSFKCTICSKSFKTPYDLNRHKKVHKIVFSCTYCPMEFSEKHFLDVHVFGHDENKKIKTYGNLKRNKKVLKIVFPCSYCPKEFSEKQLLDAHLMEDSHNNDKRLICASFFKTDNDLAQHKEVHIKYSFPCKYCPKEFSTKHLLEVHLLEHTGDNEKQFKCDWCKESFAKQTYLNRHIQDKHGTRIRIVNS